MGTHWLMLWVGASSVLGATSIAAVSGVDAATWLTFSPPDGRFTVEMPSEPKEKERNRWLPIGTVESTIYKSKVGNSTFGLSFTDLPHLAFVFRSRSSLLTAASDGFIEDDEAREISREKSNLDDREATELLYEVPEKDAVPRLNGRARLLLEDRRLYIFYTETEKGVTPSTIGRYFDSVRIRKK